MREKLGVDESLTQVVNWFRNQDHMVARFGAAIRRSLDEVVDGQRTGRYSIDELSKVEKTYIGTKVEILVRAEFGLQRGPPNGLLGRRSMRWMRSGPRTMEAG